MTGLFVGIGGSRGRVNEMETSQFGGRFRGLYTLCVLDMAGFIVSMTLELARVSRGPVLKIFLHWLSVAVVKAQLHYATNKRDWDLLL